MNTKIMGKVFFLMVFFCLLPSLYVFSLSLESLLPEDLAKQLLATGAIDRERFDTPSFGMVPRYPPLEQLLETSRRSVDPNITVESLRIYKKPLAQSNWGASERAGLFNGICSVSTLKGLEYYSKSRNAMRVLFETSAVVDGPAGKTPLPDPVFGSPPPEYSIYVRQKDLTFGDNVYQFNYFAHESCFIVVQENITGLNYGIVNVIGKKRLRSAVAVFDCGPYLLVYAASMARASMLPGMRQRAGESIANRANALLNWFVQKADRAYGKES